METKQPARNWRMIITLVLSVLGILYFLIQSLALGVLWVTGMLNTQADPTQNISTGFLVWSSILGGILLLPLFLMSIKQWKSQPMPAWLDTNRSKVGKVALWLILVWPVIVFLGWLVAGSPDVAVFLLGPINLLVAGIPILWIYNAAQWKLKTGSPIRKWRIFGLSLTVTPIVIVIVEFVAIIILGMIGVVWIAYRMSVDPSLERELTYIFNQVMLAGNDLEKLLQLLEPYLLQPSIIILIVAIVGGIMPIIEEIIKPLALWLLAGQKISPKEGFVGGLLCGAGFALMENVLYATTAVMAEDWLFMTLARAGTGALHMLASGLVGWGLATLWRDGKWIFMGLTTLGAFLLHGFWNALALISGVAPLYIFGQEAKLWQTLLFYLPLILLLLTSAAAMFLIHRYFLKQQSQKDTEKTIAPAINGKK